MGLNPAPRRWLDIRAIESQKQLPKYILIDTSLKFLNYQNNDI